MTLTDDGMHSRTPGYPIWRKPSNWISAFDRPPDRSKASPPTTPGGSVLAPRNALTTCDPSPRRGVAIETDDLCAIAEGPQHR